MGPIGNKALRPALGIPVTDETNVSSSGPSSQAGQKAALNKSLASAAANMDSIKATMQGSRQADRQVELGKLEKEVEVQEKEVKSHGSGDDDSFVENLLTGGDEGQTTTPTILKANQEDTPWVR